MARVPELLTDPHLVARGLFTRMHQPRSASCREARRDVRPHPHLAARAGAAAR
jgi:hypothetical protein